MGRWPSVFPLLILHFLSEIRELFMKPSMQIRITLEPIQNSILLDSYRSSIQGLIYHLLQRSNPEYARFLHDKGYQLPDEKRPKLKQFCFSGLHDSNLNHPRRHSRQRGYELHSNSLYSLVFCSPKEAFVKNVLFGIFQEQQAQYQQISINTCRFEVSGVELFSPFEENGKNSARLTLFHSGFVARAKPGVLPDGKQYLTLNEQELLEKQLLDGLLMRIKEHHQQEIHREDCSLRFLVSSERKKHIRKFPVVQHGNRHSLIATHCNLELQGPSGLLQMAFLTGIGEKGTLGMGMVREK